MYESILNYKKYIIGYCNNITFNKCKTKSNIVLSVKNKKLESYFINNFLIFSLSDFFFKKINNLKHRLFSIQLKKQKFPFNLDKLVSTFFPRNTNLSKLKVISLSLIYKDSNFFVSKNTFLFFFMKKNKKVFLNLLNQWNKVNLTFLKKMKDSMISLKKLQCQINITNRKKVAHIFVFPKKIYLAQLNLQKLFKINLCFIYGYFNSLNLFLNLDLFYNMLFSFLLFIKNIFFYSTLLKINSSFQFKNNNIFFLMYYSSLYLKIFSFFTYDFKTKFIFFLLEKNDVKLIWNIFIKYENHILYFNSNYIFLRSFQTILKKWVILNQILLFLGNNKKSIFSPVFYMTLYSKLFLLNQVFLEKFDLKEILDIKLNSNKFSLLSKLWPLSFFIVKEKHTFLFYKKRTNGFHFFSFFMFHTNKKNQIYISNPLFCWQFYFLTSLKYFKYIKYFGNYFKIYDFIIKNKKIVKKQQVKQRIGFLFFQSFFLQFNCLIFLEYNNFLDKLIKFSFKNQSKLHSFHLFKFIFYKIIKKKSVLIFYKKLIQQQTLKIYYYFSIKPSKSNIERHLFKIYNIVKKSHNKTQEHLIFKLSKNIKNWCLYYQIITPTILFKYLDYLTLQVLWRWACKHHYKKSKRWIKMKYFYKVHFFSAALNNLSSKTNIITNWDKKNKIIFASKRNVFINYNIQNYKTILFKKILEKHIQLNESSINKTSKKIFICLPNHSDICLIKHKLIQTDRSPFDGDFVYWIPRNLHD